MSSHDLDRRAEQVIVPPSPPTTDSLEQGDRATEKWYPQGITTSSDADSDDGREGVTSSRSRGTRRRARPAPPRCGTRVSFIDITDEFARDIAT